MLVWEKVCWWAITLDHQWTKESAPPWGQGMVSLLAPMCLGEDLSVGLKVVSLVDIAKLALKRVIHVSIFSLHTYVCTVLHICTFYKE